jgi:hypothetical protein
MGGDHSRALSPVNNRAGCPEAITGSWVDSAAALRYAKTQQ